MNAATPPGWPRTAGLLAAALVALLAALPAPAESIRPDPAAATGGPLLDGAVFDGPTGAEGRDANHIDHVVFADGRFLSQGCARWGFGEADYTAWQAGDLIHFRATTVSPTHGTLAWRGTVAGDRIEATFVWTKKRVLWTTRRAYWFRGTRVADADVAVGTP